MQTTHNPFSLFRPFEKSIVIVSSVEEKFVVSQENLTMLSQGTYTRILKFQTKPLTSMPKNACTIMLILLAISSCSTLLSGNAAPTEILVVPDDYSTISQAVSHATNGDTIYVKSGIYTEYELRINKPISLIGEGSESTKLHLQSTKHDEILYPQDPDFLRVIWYDKAMMVCTDNFVLSGFTISTSGGDINITGNNNQIKGNSIASSLTIIGNYNDIIGNTFSESPTAKRWYDYNIAGNHCNFTLNRVNGGDVNFVGTMGVISFNNVTGSFSSASDDCFFYKNFFTESGEFRVNGNKNIICRNVIDHYGSGLVLVGYNNRAMLNNITYCRIGISPISDSMMYANYIANNEWAINSRNAIINPYGNLSFLVHNNFVANRYYPMWTMVMSNITDYLDNGKEGNYWDIYRGEDKNSDGIGDSPFYLDPTHLDRYPLMNPFNLSIVEEVFPDWLIMPTVNLVSPESLTYSISNVSATFIVNKNMTWIGYSLDGLENKTITGNFTLADLSFGVHNITVYSIDEYGNQCASQTVSFTIEEPFQTTLVDAILIIGIIGFVVFAIWLFYYGKRNSKSGDRR